MVAFDAVVTDLDGTVLRSDGSVSEATLRAARTLQSRGIPLVAATARTPAGVRALTTLAPHLTYSVCCSGAVGYAPATRQFVWRERLGRSTLGDVLSYLREHLPDAGLAAYDGHEWRMSAAYQTIRTSGHFGPQSVVDVAELVDVDACAMAVCHPTLAAAELIEAFIGAGFDATRVGLGRAGSQAVEVTAKGIDKASGVARALRELNVAPERTVAFGDMPIDVPMFSIVGHSVAMAGSPPEVLAAATSQTDSADDDGFASALARMGLVAAAP